MSDLEPYNLYTAALRLQRQSQQILESFNEAFPDAPPTPLRPPTNAHVYEWKLYKLAMIWWRIEMDVYLRSLSDSDSVQDNHTEAEQTGTAIGVEQTSVIKSHATATDAPGDSSDDIRTIPLESTQVVAQSPSMDASTMDIVQLWDAATYSPSILSPAQPSLLPSDSERCSDGNPVNDSWTSDDKSVDMSVTPHGSQTYSSSHPTPHNIISLSLEDDVPLGVHAGGSVASQPLAPMTVQPSYKRKRRTSETEEHRRIPPPPGSILVHQSNARVTPSLGQNNTMTRLVSRPQDAMQQMQMPYQHQVQHAQVLKVQRQGVPVLPQFQSLPSTIGRYPPLYPCQVSTINQVLTPYHAVQHQGSLGFQPSSHLVGVNTNISRVNYDYNAIARGTPVMNMPNNTNMPQCQNVFSPPAQPNNSFRLLRPFQLLSNQAMPVTTPPGLMNVKYPFPALDSAQQVKRARTHSVPVLNATRPTATVSGSVEQQFLPRNKDLPKEKDKACEGSVLKMPLSYEIDDGLIWHTYDGANRTFQYVSSASSSFINNAQEPENIPPF
ncbi:hypothetical protein BDQ12DRAFT_726099 [Crucibulum laeve]|uniref:Uncharacterized protein n=1 Tax=Crucibulum laeve TaxID=68775 RepID=A0A5C3LTD9_9AGAR|nr:hypothetical protein BDQ12DRAFT_726099 [Crucibulum laeve]